jgi:Cellulose biosynthesis protein BcsS
MGWSCRMGWDTGLAWKRVGSLLTGIALSFGAAHANDAPRESAFALDVLPPASGSSSNKQQHVVVDSTPETNSFGNSSLDINGTFAPFGDVYESGFRARLTGSFSWYKFISGEDPRTFGSGRSTEVDLLAGYLFAFPRISILALAGGAAVESHDDGRVTERRAAKFVLSYYARPTDQTMFYGNYYFLTINNAYQFQNKVGWKVPGDFYLGPEMAFAGNERNSVRKLGGHLSGLKVGKMVVSLSAGAIHDQQFGNGKYVGVNFYGSF